MQSCMHEVGGDSDIGAAYESYGEPFPHLKQALKVLFFRTNAIRTSPSHSLKKIQESHEHYLYPTEIITEKGKMHVIL